MSETMKRQYDILDTETIKKGNHTHNSEFFHKVDKQDIPTCTILRTTIAAVNMQWVIEYIKKNVKSLSGDYICISNVHTTVMSYEDPVYCSIQNSAVMALPDGGPLSFIGKKRGYRHMNRVTGPNLMEEIFEISVENGYRHYFYGSKEDTLEKLFKKLRVKYPGVQIAGLYSPPYRPTTMEEDEAIVKMINATNSDFVWVGLGAPKQERWMAEHQGKIKGLMLGVGAGFDYFAENIKRAPEWMQKINLEWFYRLLQEPKRLFGRYLRTNSKFIWLILKGK